MHRASRKAFLAGPVCRTILFAVPLTLIACQSENADGVSTDGTDDQVYAQSSASATAASLDASEFARQAELRELAEVQYETIREWLRRNGLNQRNHAELVSLAETDTAATRYIECHDRSSSPSGSDTRLGLLSTCLMADPGTESPEDTQSPMIAVAGEPAPGT